MSVRKGKIGKEDLQLGRSTFTRVGRTGVNITLTEINSSCIPLAIKEKSGAYSLDETDGVVLANASGAGFTLTLPSGELYQYLSYKIVKTDSSSNKVTIARGGSDTINGVTSIVLASQYASVELLYTGSVWIILSHEQVVY